MPEHIGSMHWPLQKGLDLLKLALDPVNPSLEPTVAPSPTPTTQNKSTWFKHVANMQHGLPKRCIIGYNKCNNVLKRPFQLDAHFIPEEPYCTFSASARVLFHSGMFRKQINMAGCLAKPFTVSFIVDLEAKVPINGELISLKQFILMIPWPLVPARDDCGRPCMLDKEGNIICDANGCPKPPERLIMNAHTDRSQGSLTTHQTACITAKDRLTVAKTVMNVLPAFVLLTTKLCPEEWFDATRTFICETTVFGTDDDGKFNGEITTAADEEAFATVAEDIGMGCPTVELVGMELLDEPPPTIPLNNPWENMTTGTSKHSFPPRPSPTTPGDDASTIASDVTPTQQQTGSETTAVNGPRAGPEAGAPTD